MEWKVVQKTIETFAWIGKKLEWKWIGKKNGKCELQLIGMEKRNGEGMKSGKDFFLFHKGNEKKMEWKLDWKRNGKSSLKVRGMECTLF